MNIPTRNDWENVEDDLDTRDAFCNFFGKTNDEMQEKFKVNVVERCFDLSYMPIIPFKYYIFGLKQYIEHSTSDDFHRSDAASIFLNLIYERIVSDCNSMRSIIDELLPTILYVVENQEQFDADIDIYGDFTEVLKKIEVLLNANAIRCANL